jgi:AraC-like DNA-binding protein
MVSFGQSLLPLGDPHTGSPSLRATRAVESARLTELLAGRPEPGPLRADSHLIMLVTVGHGSHTLDFHRYACRPGTLIWGRPGQVHQFGGQAGLDATLLAFDTEALAGLPELAEVKHLVDDPLAPACWHPSGEDGEAIASEVAQLTADCERYASGATADLMAGDLATTLLRHQLAVLLVRIAALVPPPPMGSATSILRRLRGEMERDVQHRRVEDYADRLDCSVRTLTRACLALTGRSAKQLIDERVALEACRVLATTDLPVAEVGRRLGFDEPTNFGRFFAREVGQSPGAFRAEVASRVGPAAIPAPRSALPGYLEPLAKRQAIGR